MKLLLFVVLLFSTAYSQDKIGFVFELVRHGARAPSMKIDEDLFQVPPGMLT